MNKIMATSGTFATASSTMPFSSRKFIGAVEDEWQMYSDRESDYVVGSPIGFGASSIVHTATYQPQAQSANSPPPPPIPCALKVLDLDTLPPRSLSLLQRETTLMSLSKHPNVLRVRGSWSNGHKLYIALRLMNKGSAADVMRYGWPSGMEEDVARCILRQALQGLNYLHTNGFIHRDIKAANLLIDDDGTVLLGDLGVAADLAEDTSQRSPTSRSFPASATAFSHPQSSATDHPGAAPKRLLLFDNTVPISKRPKIGKRKSFVGTPCWMAPELIQGQQYDSSADIWSFGITALELTQGRPPRSRETPQRVLLRTIQDDPPTLDREGGPYKYSRAFQEMVESCLVKDPSKRPTAEDLLQTPFFKAAKKKSYLVGAILEDLPPLTQRQERRVIHGSQTMQSLDSWDFAVTTLYPGVPSLHHRTLSEDVHLASGVEEAGVFNVEDPTFEPSARGHRNWGNLKAASRIDETNGLEGSLDIDQSASHEPAFSEAVGPSPSPSSSHPSDSSPSSSRSVYKGGTSILENPTSPLYAQKSLTNTDTENLPIDITGSRSSVEISSASPPSSLLASSPRDRRLSSSPTPRQGGLWKKVKSNVLRTAPRKNLNEDEKNRAPPSNNKPNTKRNQWRRSLLDNFQ